MTNMTRKLAMSIVALVGFVGCAAEPAPARDLATTEQAVTCTPGYETCDVGCYYDGGPSTDDCIIQCNATGTGWITLENCGYAQNFPYSASCLNSQPHPICQNN
jgi:hypothetical protein